jgi:iron-sulfur cluster insertion protein
MITITDSAVDKLKNILAEEANPALKLRVFVQGGGCSGMQYGFTLDETQAEDDWEIEVQDVKILVDSMSGGYLQGAEIDFKEDQYGASLVSKIPTHKPLAVAVLALVLFNYPYNSSTVQL